jgi:hypothetical protein
MRKVRRKTRRTRKHKRRSTRQRGGSSDLKDITLGILSWKSPLTIRNTLDSYKKNGLLRMVKPLIYFQERTPEDDALAKEYGITDVMGKPSTNAGIIGGMIEMIEATKTKYFIFAECDFELVNDEATTKKILKEAMKLMEEKDVQLVRLRDKKRPGEPLGSRAFAPVPDEELPNFAFNDSFPYKIEVVMFPGDIQPDKVFPGLFERTDYETPWYKTSSEHAPWSNNIFIARTDFLKEKLLPLLELNREMPSTSMEGYLIQNLGGYNVAAGNGLFMHNRVDR